MLATDKFNSGGVGLQNTVLALPSGEVLLAPPGVAFSISGDDLGCDPGWPPEHRSRQAAHAWAVQTIGAGVGGQGVSCQCSWLANTPQRVICRWLVILGVMHSGRRQLPGHAAGQLCGSRPGAHLEGGNRAPKTIHQAGGSGRGGDGVLQEKSKKK